MKVLLVEDNAVTRTRIQSHLTKWGYEVITASDGAEGWEAFLADPVPMVVTDWEMPEMDGIELIHNIRERHPPGDVYILTLTGRGEVEDVVEAMEAGADDYLCKPFARSELQVRVQAGARLVELNRELQEANLGLERHNAFVKRMLGRYVADAVVRELLEQPEGVDLEPASREVTILLSDLRGFSPLCERLSPEQVMTLLNSYFGAMTEVIERYRGTINDFIGDAILTFFGAPIRKPDDPIQAVRCAAAMQLAMARVNEDLAAQDLPRIEMGIAVHTGPVVAGNIGSERRAKYTLVGRHVNLCARIESYSVGGQVLLSPRAVQILGDDVRYEDLYEVWPKGFAHSVHLYDLKAVRQADGSWLEMPDAEPELEPMAPALPVTFLAADAGGARPSEGSIIASSDLRAMVQGPAPKLLSNVRLQMSDLPDAGELYAKVLERHDDRFQGRFTAVPPAFARVLGGRSEQTM